MYISSARTRLQEELEVSMQTGMRQLENIVSN